MRTGQTRRRDALEPAVVRAWAAIGIQSWAISSPGFADRICYDAQRRIWLPVEIKSGAAGTVTPAQQRARQAAPYPIVRSVAEGLALFGVTA